MEPILAGRAKDYLPRNVDQRRLLPVDRREWLPEGHLAQGEVTILLVGPFRTETSLGRRDSLSMRA